MVYNNINYTKQRSRADCAPTLIANILKWRGLSFNYRQEYKMLCDLLECDPEIGTLTTNINKYFKTATVIKSFYKEDPELDDIKVHLYSGGAIAFFYDVGNGNRHVALIIKSTNNGFYFVNHSRKATFTEISSSVMKRFMSKKTYAFFIE